MSLSRGASTVTEAVVPSHRSVISHRNLPMLLLRAREKIMVRFRPLLKMHGVTEQQWRIIRALHEHGAAEPREISDLCTLSSPSLAGILTRMESLGLVCKQRFDHDRRRVLVSLTPKSMRLVRCVSAELEENYCNLEALVGSRTVARAYESLDALLSGLEQRGKPQV